MRVIALAQRAVGVDQELRHQEQRNPARAGRRVGQARQHEMHDIVGEIVLAGGCALTPNLQQVLRERFGVPIEVLDPLRRIHYREGDFDRDWLRSISPMLAVAVGLAIRKVGG